MPTVHQPGICNHNAQSALGAVSERKQVWRQPVSPALAEAVEIKSKYLCKCATAVAAVRLLQAACAYHNFSKAVLRCNGIIAQLQQPPIAQSVQSYARNVAPTTLGVLREGITNHYSTTTEKKLIFRRLISDNTRAQPPKSEGNRFPEDSISKIPSIKRRSLYLRKNR